MFISPEREWIMFKTCFSTVKPLLDAISPNFHRSVHNNDQIELVVHWDQPLTEMPTFEYHIIVCEALSQHMISYLLILLLPVTR